MGVSGRAAGDPVRRRSRSVLSVAWALVPIATLGLGTPLAFAFASARLRSRLSWLATAGYAVVAAAAVVAPQTPAMDDLTGGGLVVVNVLVATVHALLVRRAVFLPARDASGMARAVTGAERRHRLREEARALADRAPLTAMEIGIGRPDLARGYDDGGLIDVNDAPAEALVRLPGITPESARKIVELRAEQGRFVSPEELSLCLGLPPDMTPVLAEYAVFLQPPQ